MPQIPHPVLIPDTALWCHGNCMFFLKWKISMRKTTLSLWEFLNFLSPHIQLCPIRNCQNWSRVAAIGHIWHRHDKRTRNGFCDCESYALGFSCPIQKSDMIGWKLDITFHGVDGQHFLLHIFDPLHHSDKPQMCVEIIAKTSTHLEALWQITSNYNGEFKSTVKINLHMLTMRAACQQT